MLQRACDLSQDKSFLVTIFNKIAATLIEQSQKIALKAQEYSHKAEKEDFYNYSKIKARDLEKFTISYNWQLFNKSSRKCN